MQQPADWVEGMMKYYAVKAKFEEHQSKVAQSQAKSKPVRRV